MHKKPDNINYDEKLLAQRVGGELPPLTSFADQATARALTDSALQKGETPKERFSNARYWLQRAYEEGKEAGKCKERAKWELRIAKLFGIKIRSEESGA